MLLHGYWRRKKWKFKLTGPPLGGEGGAGPTFLSKSYHFCFFSPVGMKTFLKGHFFCQMTQLILDPISRHLRIFDSHFKMIGILSQKRAKNKILKTWEV